MLSVNQLQDEIVRLQIRISELERENADLKNPPAVSSPTKINHPSPIDFSVPPPAPPSFLGGPPPPPPPLMNRVLKTQVRKPKCKMRGLFWNKLKRPAGTHSNLKTTSLWDQVERLGSSLYLDDKLASLLESNYSTLERSSSALGRTRSREAKAIEVLDSKRATNLSIQHNGLPDHWLSSLETLDLTALSEEQVEQLKIAQPTKEELGDIDTAINNNPNKPLRIAEQFLWQLGSVPWIQEKLSCWSLTLKFPSLSKSIQERCDLINSAIFELRMEPNIFRIMSLVLSAGNFLNSGTARGDAYGFSYNLLAGLSDMKNNEKNSNLLLQLARQVQERELIQNNLQGTIELFATAGKFTLAEVESNLAELTAEFNTCQRMLQYVASREPEELLIDRFAGNFEEFQSELSCLQKDVNSCHQDLNELLGWLGMSVAEMSTVSTSDLFVLWQKFFKALST